MCWAWRSSLMLRSGTKDGTALTGIAVFAAAAWLAMRSGKRRESRRERRRGVEHDCDGGVSADCDYGGTADVAGAAVHPGWRICCEYASSIPVGGLLDCAAGAGDLCGRDCCLDARCGESARAKSSGRRCAATSTIAFNLIAVLTGVREVGACGRRAPNAWTADAGLQQALAISAFLMLYGAVLLAVGFWRRSGFLRWQALVLLVFTILQDVPVRHAQPEPGISRGELAGSGRAADGDQLCVPEGLAESAWTRPKPGTSARIRGSRE